MRVIITNDKQKIAPFLFGYMQLMMVGKKVEIIINGNKCLGLVDDLRFDAEDDTWVEIVMAGEIKKLPLTDETKARLGKEIFYFETKTHHTVIEFVD